MAFEAKNITANSFITQPTLINLLRVLLRKLYVCFFPFKNNKLERLKVRRTYSCEAISTFLCNKLERSSRGKHVELNLSSVKACFQSGAQYSGSLGS